MAKRFLQEGRLGRTWVTRLMPGDELLESIVRVTQEAGVARAVVLSAHNLGWEVFGIRRGYRGLLTGEGVVPLGPDEVRGITHTGGTILGTTIRGKPFRWVEKDDTGSEIEVDRSDELIAKFKDRGFDALVAIECRESQAALRHAIEDVFSDAPRSDAAE